MKVRELLRYERDEGWEEERQNTIKERARADEAEKRADEAEKRAAEAERKLKNESWLNRVCKSGMHYRFVIEAICRKFAIYYFICCAT